jgi:hypothetical protein
MAIAHEHNLVAPIPTNKRFGFRVRLRSTDPFRNLLGGDLNKEHWFETERERDEAMKDMSGRYVYFRPGDQPTLTFEKIER